MIFFGFFLIVFLIIAHSRGYRVNLQKKTVTSTGILAVSSFPKAAKVYLNGKLKGVTDLNLNLEPGEYQVEVKKEGYASWQKKIKLKGELVITLDALLFPLNPSFSPLTNLGVKKALPLDQTDKVLLYLEKNDPEKDGFYILDIEKKPIGFFEPLKLILKKSLLPSEEINLEEIYFDFSPNFKEAILNLKEKSYLLSLDQENQNLFDVSNSKQMLLDAWQKEKEKNTQKILETFKKDLVKIATDSFHIISFSPDETKILYQAKKNFTLPIFIKPSLPATNQTEETRDLKKDYFYVYDKKEDKNYEINLINLIDLIAKKNKKFPSNLSREEKLEIENFLMWYPDSKHLVLNEDNKIYVFDYDGQNKQVLYSGPYEKDFFLVSSSGNLILLINLNPENNQLPDIYQVGLK
jgi:PEGA domain.